MRIQTTFTQLSTNQQQVLREASEDYLFQAQKIFSYHTIRTVRVKFDLQGSIAGQYCSQDLTIRYNPQIAAKHYAAFKCRTLAHEVAHHVVYEVWGGRRYQRIAPHGKEWQSVMQLLGVSDINRCHSYDLQGIKVKRQQRHAYRCHCKKHAISTTRHNRIQRGMEYYCKSCRQLLSADSIKLVEPVEN